MMGFDSETGQELRAKFAKLKRRIRKRFYYGSEKFFKNEPSLDGLSLPLSGAALSYFDRHAPFDYLEEEFAMRLSREGCVDPCCFLVALVYLEKMRALDRHRFESSDPSDLYLTALVLASKYLYDPGEEDFVYNDEWATSAGIDLARLNRMEIDFLMSTGWQLAVKNKEFENMMSRVETCVAISQCESRDWLSYTESLVLLDSLLRNDSASVAVWLHSLSKTIAALIASYIGLTLGLIGLSSLLASTATSISLTRPGTGTGTTGQTTPGTALNNVMIANTDPRLVSRGGPHLDLMTTDPEDDMTQQGMPGSALCDSRRIESQEPKMKKEWFEPAGTPENWHGMDPFFPEKAWNFRPWFSGVFDHPIFGWGAPSDPPAKKAGRGGCGVPEPPPWEWDVGPSALDLNRFGLNGGLGNSSCFVLMTS